MLKDLDRIDFAILDALQEDARLTNKELAARVHLAPSSCLERVRRLRETGVLRGTHADVDPNALGVGIEAMIAVRLRQYGGSDATARFFDDLAAKAEVVAMYYLAGRTDFLIHVAVRDVRHLRDFAVDTVAARPQVAEVETQIVFEHRRRHGWPRYRD